MATKFDLKILITEHNFQCFKAECIVQRTKFEGKTTILNLKRIINAKTIRTMKLNPKKELVKMPIEQYNDRYINKKIQAKLCG